MIDTLTIAGYCRISVDEELDRDNTSIENQKAIISEFVKQKFPGSTLDFYTDRDRSGYTFEQREGYQQMRPLLMSKKYDILVVKDFSRFSRRNSRGLVELEDLRDAGVRIISIGDSIDYPTYDDWTSIQFRFLVNEMPVTDASKKVKSVVKNRQSKGEWICAAPYGYIVNKKKEFEIVPTEADIVREIFKLYIGGWGYKRIANHLTELGIPTPRMAERDRKEASEEEYHRKVNTDWSIVTIQNILDNDFYIGTLRQGKFTRRKINGRDFKQSEDNHIIFEHHHQEIIDYRTFATVRALRLKRTNSNYRGVKKFDNVYSGFLECGDCGSPMFAMSRSDIKEAYRCGTYHRRGLKGCTSHHIRVETLDTLVKEYVRKVKENSSAMLDRLNREIQNEKETVAEKERSAANLADTAAELREELKATKRQRIRDIMKHPEQEEILVETYDEIENELAIRIAGLENQIALAQDKRNAIIQVNRIAKTALDVFDDILKKEKLERNDLELVLKKIKVYEDHIEVELQPDIDSLLKCGELTAETAANFDCGTGDSKSSVIVQCSQKHNDKIFRVNVINEGDPLEIYTNSEGEVIFKKYSPINEMSESAASAAEVIHKLGSAPVVIFDRDHVVAVSGLQKKEYAERRLSPGLEEVLDSRKSWSYDGDGKPILPVEGVSKNAIAISPIIASGDIAGAVCFLAPEADSKGTQLQLTLTQTAAMFLGRQLEE